MSELGERVDNLIIMMKSSINIMKMSENDYHLKNAIRLLDMTINELLMYKNRKNKKKEED